jgi:hypothetical protein
MAATGKSPNYEFPYPLSSDVVDVAGDIELLAKDIDSSIAEIVQDTVQGMVVGNTENGISVVYNDELGKLNFNVTVIPNQTSNEGKYLTTNGTDVSWGEVDALPDQTGNDGKFLTTDGEDASWVIGSFGDVDVTSPITNSGTSTSPNIGIDLSNIAPIQSPTFTGTVTTSDGITNAQGKNALVASGFNSASGGFAQASRVIMTMAASGSSAPTTRPDGSPLVIGDLWFSF